MTSRLRVIAANAPLIADIYHRWWSFPRSIGACRGVYASRQEAAAKAPRGIPFGYSQATIVDHPNPAQLTSTRIVGAFNKKDYPVLVWLAKAFENSSNLFDLGGNVGLEYYAYRRFVRYPPDLRWLVCELPELCQVGRQLANKRGVKDLAFTEDLVEAEGCDILLSCGALQYLPKSLAAILESLIHKPRHVIIQRTPLCEGPTYYTMQNIGYALCPYRIQSRLEFMESIKALGYHEVDYWKDSRECHIPFHPSRTVRGYSGAYFTLR